MATFLMYLKGCHEEILFSIYLKRDRLEEIGEQF